MSSFKPTLKISLTGDVRDIANSAWISTISESRAKTRSDDDVMRVVKFLAENLHTSPFESVTISAKSNRACPELYPYYKNKYVRYIEHNSYSYEITCDLLNFAKISYDCSFDTFLWKQFQEEHPVMAKVLKSINFGLKQNYPNDVSGILGDHNMLVELVSSHVGVNKSHSRATWRVRCPLSVAVQILRHRTGSFNMVSGRYKTIRQENYNVPKDILEILLNAGFKHFDDYSDSTEKSSEVYIKIMKSLRTLRDDSGITNDEYKRCREFFRFCLPEGRMTELYITFYLDDFDNFLKLRNSPHAQIEHIWIAQQMKKKLENKK